MGGGHIYGNNFFRKYAPPQKFSHQNWQIYVIFLHLKCHFFCDINKLPNLHDHFKISPNKILRKYRENFFRNYAPFFIQRGGIITEMTVLCHGHSPCFLQVGRGKLRNVYKIVSFSCVPLFKGVGLAHLFNAIWVRFDV